MKRIFVINNCTTLCDIAYCSKRIKEYMDANCVPYEPCFCEYFGDL